MELLKMDYRRSREKIVLVGFLIKQLAEAFAYVRPFGNPGRVTYTYDTYRDFCYDNGRHAMSKQEFAYWQVKLFSTAGLLFNVGPAERYTNHPLLQRCLDDIEPSVKVTHFGKAVEVTAGLHLIEDAIDFSGPDERDIEDGAFVLMKRKSARPVEYVVMYDDGWFNTYGTPGSKYHESLGDYLRVEELYGYTTLSIY